MGDVVVVRKVFTEVQLFKGVEIYFTDSLLHQEDIEPLKQSLPNDVDVDTPKRQTLRSSSTDLNDV